MAGRPRSEQARDSVLRAAIELVEADGYGGVTIEGIARRAEVSKQTVYRWWSGKAEVVMEALMEVSAQHAPAPDTGTLAGDLEELLGRTVQAAGAGSGRVLAGLMAEAQLDMEFAESFRNGFLAGRRAILRSTIELAVERGETGTDEQGWPVDPELVTEVVFGTLWYRILSADGPLDRAFADSLVRTALALAGVRRG